jgi:23S rRNA (guanosine2251-2'-O)-methyltransferase
MIIYGKNPVYEACKTNKCKKVFVKQGTKIDFKKIGKNFETIEPHIFDKKYGASSQGIAAEIDFEYQDFEILLDDIIKNGKVVILDHIVDPHNFGAIIRSAHCFGFNNIIVAKDNQVSVTPTVFKTSAGSLLYSNIIEVTNIARTLDELKKYGFFVYAADIRGDIKLSEVNFSDKSVIIIGSEENGIRKNVLKRADVTFKIPMNSKIDSLNASQSASIIFYEAMKSKI